MKYLKSFEGKTFNAAKKGPGKTEEEIDAVRRKMVNVIKSKECDTKKIGSDIEVHDIGKHLGNVIFRKDYIGVQTKGKKFIQEFKYTEFGKAKAEVEKMVKEFRNKED